MLATPTIFLLKCQLFLAHELAALFPPSFCTPVAMAVYCWVIFSRKIYACADLNIETVS